ncbi:MAG: glycosyltransferase family 4 protein [Candidatus Omnitrophica bacterium]|nr:glycosyltransferase family 4 protein [Candidatus Omnitrophota bacterium]
MNVLHLTTHLNTGGITTYILRLFEPLKQLGCNLSVLSAGGACVPAFQEKGMPVYEMPIRTKNELHPKLYFSIPSILRLIREKEIDVLHAHTRITQVLAFWIHQLTGIPVVTTCHGFYKLRLGRRLLPAWGDAVIAISDGVADHLRDDFKVPVEKIHTIYNAVDIDYLEQAAARFKPEEVKMGYGFNEQDMVIGVVARLVADKGHEYLIRAVAGLIKKIPQIRLMIVGDGRERAHLEELVQQLGIHDKVCFTGNVDDITHPLAAFDVFALPATWREGFGLSIVEAMACGIPVVVTNIWSLNTLIENGVTGMLVAPKDPEALSSAIEMLLNDKERRQNMVREAKKMVRQLFTLSRMASEVSEIYQKVKPSLTSQSSRL